MSRNWAQGSTRRWRRLRAQILDRDRHQCQIRLPGCTTHATHVHHVKGRAFGDDPKHLVAACQQCNLAVGDPMAQRHDPPASPKATW